MMFSMMGITSSIASANVSLIPSATIAITGARSSRMGAMDSNRLMSGGSKDSIRSVMGGSSARNTSIRGGNRVAARSAINGMMDVNKLINGGSAYVIKSFSGSLSAVNSSFNGGNRDMIKSVIGGSKSRNTSTKIGMRVDASSAIGGTTEVNKSIRIGSASVMSFSSGSFNSENASFNTGSKSSPSCCRVVSIKSVKISVSSGNASFARSITGFRKSPNRSITSGSTSSITGSASWIRSDSSGISSSPRGSTSISTLRFSPSNMEPRSSYLTFFSSSILPAAQPALSPILFNCVTTSGPRSSHMVPNNCTPMVFCFNGSSMLESAVMVSWNAFFADSPPAANFFAILSAFKPSDVNPSAVLSDPSIALLESSLIASPTLSRFHAPVHAPFCIIWNISSAVNPSFANCTEYSLMLSIISPE